MLRSENLLKEGAETILPIAAPHRKPLRPGQARIGLKMWDSTMHWPVDLGAGVHTSLPYNIPLAAACGLDRTTTFRAPTTRGAEP